MEHKPVPEEKAEHRRMFTHTHEKRSLSRWIIPLVIILAVIIFLPRIMEIMLPD